MSFWARFKLFAADVYYYFVDHPGVATLLGSAIVMLAARFGLHVTIDQLYAIVAALLPLVIGAHVGARRVRENSPYF